MAATVLLLDLHRICVQEGRVDGRQEPLAAAAAREEASGDLDADLLALVN